MKTSTGSKLLVVFSGILFVYSLCALVVAANLKSQVKSDIAATDVKIAVVQAGWEQVKSECEFYAKF